MAVWWLDEIGDPAYDEVVTPLLFEVFDGVGGGGVVADLGCGEGRVVPAVVTTLDAKVVGVELVEALAQRVGTAVVVARLPGIPFADDAIDGAYAVLVLDHLEDHGALFDEAARVVRAGGFLAVVSNHPIWTAPGSTPIADTDGEVLWRPGRYFEGGTTEEPAGEGKVVFYHRSISDLFNSATAAGWSLEKVVEKPHHGDGVDPGIPRLIGIRWRLVP